MPSLFVGTNVAAQRHFHHWELVFTELLGPNVDGLPPPHGIDLMAGNPPWIKVGWHDAPLLDEFEPLLGVRGTKSAGYKIACCASGQIAPNTNGPSATPAIN
jgi:hypothetical protein